MSGRETRTISFTPEHAAFMATLVQSGRYHTASEVVREGLRLLQDQEQMRQLRLSELHGKIAEGLEQLDRGEGLPAEQVFDDLMRRLESLRDAGKKRHGA